MSPVPTQSSWKHCLLLSGSFQHISTANIQTNKHSGSGTKKMEEEMLHRTVSVNGINMHVAEAGKGPLVLLLHGFPELWFSWRHQIPALAALGYRAVAPDLRGYGATDAPPSLSSYTLFQIVGDLVALIDVLGAAQEEEESQAKVFLVGHDWGAYLGWYLCLFRPDMVKAYVALSVPFMPCNPSIPVLPALRALYGDDYYICRFQEPGATEADIVQTGSATFIKIFLTLRDPGPLIVPKGGFADWPDKLLPLPSWLSEDDISYYADNFNKTGFTGGLNYYRSFDKNWELIAPWTGAKVKVPAKYIAGDLDLAYNTMGSKEYVNSERFKQDVPFLEEVVIIKGVGHFIQQEIPGEITAHIHEFFKKF